MPLQQKQASLVEYLTYDDVLLLPSYSEITPPETNLETFLTHKTLLQVPIIAAPMDTVCESLMARRMGELGGLGILHRNLSIEEQGKQLKEAPGAGVAVGVGPDFKERVQHLVSCGATLVCIDCAHGHTKGVIEAIRALSNVEIMAGNVVTYEGAKALFDAGADIVKVGVGPGAICTTRVMAGVGAPQLTAVMECARAAEEAGKTIIADGGIKTSGDIVKALAAGASAVMLGSLLAGTEEAPGKRVGDFKEYRGMGSVAAMQKGSAERYGLKPDKPLVPQGVEGKVPYKGSLESHLYQLTEGLRAGMGYVGAADLAELREKARFVRQTSNGLFESHPHTVIPCS
ncbi:MAG: IMP dehydrogenase [Chlamydiales bacterium]|nr:IMP dehydrogenase [Chlamydiales bacterium]